MMATGAHLPLERASATPEHPVSQASAKGVSSRHCGRAAAVRNCTASATLPHRPTMAHVRAIAGKQQKRQLTQGPLQCFRVLTRRSGHRFHASLLPLSLTPSPAMWHPCLHVGAGGQGWGEVGLSEGGKPPQTVPTPHSDSAKFRKLSGLKNENRPPFRRSERAALVDSTLQVGCSAGEAVYCAEEFLVRGVGVDARRDDGLVSCEPLGESDVFADAVDVGAGGVSEGVEVEASLEACAFLPDGEGVADHPLGEALAESADEDGGVLRELLSGASSCVEELGELGADGVGEDGLLGVDVFGGALEDAEGDSALDIAVCIEEVANIEGDDLVEAEACAEGDAVDDVVSEAVDALACDFEQGSLLGIGEGRSGAGDGVSVGGHSIVSGCGMALLLTQLPLSSTAKVAK